MWQQHQCHLQWLLFIATLNAMPCSSQHSRSHNGVAAQTAVLAVGCVNSLWQCGMHRQSLCPSAPPRQLTLLSADSASIKLHWAHDDDGVHDDQQHGEGIVRQQVPQHTHCSLSRKRNVLPLFCTWHMMMTACATTSIIARTVSASRCLSWPLRTGKTQINSIRSSHY